MEAQGVRYYFKGFCSLARGFWNIRKRPKICLVLTTVISFLLVSVYLNVLLNDWYRTFWNVLQNYEFDAFWPQVGRFSVIAFLYITLGVYSVYLQQMIQIEWRQWMTEKHLNNWLSGQAYYKLKLLYSDVDNPDQRIAEDINQFIGLTLSLTLGLLRQVLTLMAFIVVLWNLSGVLYIPIAGQQWAIYGYMVWLSLIYSVAGTYLTHKVGKALIGLNYQQQTCEADFRFSMMRMRENSDCVAFYRGEKPEKKNFVEKFAALVNNFRRIMVRQKMLNAFTVGYSQLAVIIPILFVAPKWFDDRVQVGWIMQVLNAFGQVQGAMSYLVSSYTDVAQWCAVVQRLYHFQEHTLEAGELVSKLQFKQGEDLRLKDVEIDLPAGEVLARKLSFDMKDIDFLLISANSGTGKSTMLKAMAGLWPYAEGEITMPAPEDVLFLPQRPYLPMGTLGEALAYPELWDKDKEDAVKSYLRECELTKLSDKLDEVEDWSKILSLGEQQRLAFIRIFLYKPRYVFLDEATSALDEVMESKMYRLLKQVLPEIKIISVGHRSTLVKEHNYKLILGEDKIWKIERIK